MPAKQFLFDEAAREAIKRGVEKISNAVRYTLGPRGRSVVIDKSWGAPNITRDGASVAEDVELEDPNEDMGARMIREAATKTGDEAGDGTTTSVVLARAMFLEGLKAVTAGAGPMDLARGITRAAQAVGDQIKKMAETIDAKDKERIKQIARIASGGSEEVGDMLHQAFAKVGKDGAVSVEEGKGIQTEIKTVEGMQFDRGFLSPHFVTNPESVECVLEDPLILIHEDKLASAAKLVPLLERVVSAKRPLLVIAEEVEGDALATLVVNKLRGVLPCCAVKAPGYGDRRRAMLEDLAILTGAEPVFKDLGIDLEKLDVRKLGKAKKVIVDNDYTTILEGAGSKEKVKARCEQIRREMEETESDYDREKLQERLSRLSGGVAQILVGGATEVQLKERKKLVENALSSVRAALEEGIVPGGGVALIRAEKALDGLKLSAGEAVGIGVVRRALDAPLRQIAENAGMDGSLVARRVREGKDDLGFDAEELEYKNLKKAGIIDPAKVTYYALVNAASVAAMLLTTDTLVSEVREKKKKAEESEEDLD